MIRKNNKLETLRRGFDLTESCSFYALILVFILIQIIERFWLGLPDN